MAKPSFPLHASPYITRPPFPSLYSPPTRARNQAKPSILPSKQSQRACKKASATPQLLQRNQSVMDKVLAFSILSASPADIAPGSDATGGSWARLSWRGMKLQDAQAGHQAGQTAEAEQLGRKGKSQSQLPPQEETRRPRFAPEFDGIDCFETIVWR
ncbi:uncharacterized protein LOC124682777 [Lolium rigidum]|uniref:uncharacterized protein LOC124682777 n=1 Tax=Lolium rigidum TaxID=89674 RepID=UPI001F5C2095|nr:uncharacterized protein LOC124682777 [Lolium rigidum]